MAHEHHHHHETPDEMIRKAWTAYENGDEHDAWHWYGHVEAAQLEDPSLLQAFGWLALAFHEEQKAQAALNKALRIDGNQAQSWLLLGNVQRRLKEWTQAEKSFRQVLRLEAENTDGLYNLAITLEDQQEYTKAEEILQKAIALAPLDADLLNAHGSVLDAMRMPEKAITAYRRAIQLDPDFAPLKFNLSQVLLQTKQWKEGWELYDARLQFRDTDKFPETNAAIWKGENLKGKSILVWSEQGFGDTIQFIRFLPQLKAQGAKVVFRVQEGLLRLFKDLTWCDEVLPDNIQVPDTDYEIPLLSLPRYLDMDLALKETPFSYLTGGECFIPALRESKSKKRIGFVWAGNAYHPDDQRRSISGGLMKSLFSHGNFEAVSLQVGKAAQQVNDKNVLQTAEWLQDWTDTAAAIAKLDLVISVDTAVAHLAGAMNKPVWLLLDYSPDWRWGQHAETSKSWYPKHRIFQQQKPGDWKGVIEKVKQALSEEGF